MFPMFTRKKKVRNDNPIKKIAVGMTVIMTNRIKNAVFFFTFILTRILQL